MIWFVYYSKSGATARFVHQELLNHPNIRLKARARRIFSRSPHGPAQGFSDAQSITAIPNEPSALPEVDPRPAPRDYVVVCVPTYGRFDMRAGRAVDYIPKPLARWVDRADAAIVFGNRNFGADYCAAKRELPRGVPVLGEVELSGDSRVADQVVTNLLDFLSDN